MGCIFITLRILQNLTIAIKKLAVRIFSTSTSREKFYNFSEKKTLLSVSDLYHKLEKDQREKKF